MALYRVDPFTMIWVDDLRPLWALMTRLAAEPWSLWRAKDELDELRFYGYTPEAERLDNVQDELKNVQYTLVKANVGKKRVPKPDYVDRPQTNKEPEPADIDSLGSFFNSP